MGDTRRKTASTGHAGQVVSLTAPLSGGRSNPHRRVIEIPPLYRRPAPDRDIQGCMKARA